MKIKIHREADAAPAAGGAPAATPAASPAPTNSGSQPSPSATTKKIDYGMGTKGSSQNTAVDDSDDTFFQQHGERIFKHPRFKELSGYKQKFDQLQPINQLVEKFGGVEELQRFEQFFGPVYKHLIAKGDSANQAWQKLYPYLTKFLNDEDFEQAKQAQAEAQQAQGDVSLGEEEDPRFKNLTSKVEQLEGKLTQKEQQELRANRTSAAQRYESLLHKKFEEAQIPEHLKKHAAKLMITDIGNYMPKDHQGNPLNPLDHYNEKAFNDAWEQSFLGLLKDTEGYYKNKITKKTEEGGPALPDTSASGRTAAGKQMMPDRHAKSARLAQFLKSGG